jgi:hypothetical protein
MIDLVRKHGGGGGPTKGKKRQKPKKPEKPNLCRCLQIELDGVVPKIWRTVIIPSDATFGWLHAVIQIAMGWTNSHLHHFRFGKTIVSDPAFELNSFEDDPPLVDENKARLKGWFDEAEAVLVYEYDFGDSWFHQITLGKAGPLKGGIAGQAVCVDGARACPPEDCGGICGYDEFLKAMRNPKHPEHRSMKEWIGGKFDGERFSVDQTNRWLSKLPWPRVTESALRKVLMSRDGDNA